MVDITALCGCGCGTPPLFDRMDTSVIDLCDSASEDGDGVCRDASAFAAAAAGKAADDVDDGSEHSSSSSDIDLWSTGESSRSLRTLSILICFFPTYNLL